MEDSKTVSAIRMCHIVPKFTKLGVLGANICVEGRSNGRLLSIVPVTVAVRAGRVIVPDDVVRVSDPDASRGLIRVEQTPRAANINNQIAFDEVSCLGSILDEDSVSHGVIGNIVLHAKVMDSVDGHCPIESVMDSIVPHVGRVYSTDHVEVNWVRAKDEGLANIVKLDTVDSGGRGLITWGVHDDHCTVLVIS